MNYTDAELKQVKQAELEILQIADQICKENNIEYFIAYGTTLGAVRHGGFIPWDNDIDIGMLREDYEKFLKIAPSYLKKPYALQTYNTDKYSPFLFSKIRKTDTVFLEYANKGSKMMGGVYVDVFPFDEVPVDSDDKQKQFKKIQRLNRLNVMNMVADVSQPPTTTVGKAKAMIRKVIYAFCQIIPHSLITNNYEKTSKKYNGCGSDMFACLFYPKYVEYARTELVPSKSIMFEGNEFSGPADPEGVLTKTYGDYMTLPPEDQGTGHRPYKVKLEK